MSWKKFAGFVLLFLFAANLFAQGDISIQQPGIVGFPANANINSDCNFILHIKNTGTTAYSGSLVLHFQINGIMQDVCTFNNVALNPGENTVLSVNSYFFDPSIYRLGKNGVVIWVSDDNFGIVSNTDGFETMVFNNHAN